LSRLRVRAARFAAVRACALREPTRVPPRVRAARSAEGAGALRVPPKARASCASCRRACALRVPPKM
jgi:hypothetical protein